MLTINTENSIGKGRDRVCYEHPTQSNRCIKVTHKDPKQSINDKNYYKKLEKRNISWDMIARYYGEEETSLGTGLVFEKILDYDNKVSQPLNIAINSIHDEATLNAIIEKLAVMRDYLLQEKIIFRDLRPQNILFCRVSPDEFKLVIIDGIGNSDYIPLADYAAWYARRKIKRRWTKLIGFLHLHCKSNEAFLRLLDTHKSTIE